MSAQLKRNDACHCKSGIKYKNCHGKADGIRSYPWTIWIGIVFLIIGFSFIPDNGQDSNSPALKPYVPSVVKSINKDTSIPPAGKVWSEAHGHWHDKENNTYHSHSNQQKITDESRSALPGKVWSKEHGHWHDKTEK